jgi:hypothetical protein
MYVDILSALPHVVRESYLGTTHLSLSRLTPEYLAAYFRILKENNTAM